MQHYLNIKKTFEKIRCAHSVMLDNNSVGSLIVRYVPLHKTSVRENYEKFEAGQP